MSPYIQAHQKEFTDIIESCKRELSHIRSGQANPDLLDGINVQAYGTVSELKQLASVTVPEPKLIVVQPWDKSILKDIEKAIQIADLGFSVVNDGTVIRLPMPPMTEENRRDLVKLVKEKSERFRVSIRQVRETIKESIIKAEKDKAISEDDKFMYLKELDKHTSEQVETINKLAEAKSEQIMTI